MKQYHPSLTLALLIIIHLLSACSREKVDMIKPEIDFQFDGAGPLQCDTLYFGESFRFRMNFSDNLELGSYTLDIHQNFDHHSHSTEIGTCPFDPVKQPVNPWVYIQDYPIAAGLQLYQTNLEIPIPAGDGEVPYDEGDYHLVIRVTDKSGWSAFKGLSIKILHSR
jgi:hypothetical protein